MFQDLKLSSTYIAGEDDFINDFFIPLFKNSKRIDRASGFFSAKALAMYGEGLEYFANNGGKFRIIISQEISKEDLEQIKQGYELRASITQEMLNELNQDLTLKEQMGISNLAYLVANKTVDIKIAFKEVGMYHPKFGYAIDANGDIIDFNGSNNESENGLMHNYESFTILCSWMGDDDFYRDGIRKKVRAFEKTWNNQCDDLVVLPAPEVITNKIISYSKGHIIVDENLLDKNAFVLDYDKCGKLYINPCEPSSFLKKTVVEWSGIPDLISKIEGHISYFDDSLNYKDYLNIDKELNQIIPQLGFKYYCTERFKAYIKEKDYQIERRCRFGTECKTDAGRLANYYEEFKSLVNSLMVRQLREKQMQDAFFMSKMLRSANFSVPGSGKTTSAMAVYAYLKYKNLVDKIVMIGPKNAFGAWIDEFPKCFGNKEKLVFFSCQDPSFKNSSKSKQEYDLLHPVKKYNLYLFNYEALERHSNVIANIVSERTLLVFDEVHRAKRVEASSEKKSPKLGKYASNSLKIAKKCSYKIVMTGTPIPNSYLDIYNFLHFLYPDEYDDYFGFRLNQLANPSLSDKEYINRMIQPFFCRTSKNDLNVPPANKDKFKAMKVTAIEQEIFEILQNIYHNNVLALFIRILQLESNPDLLLKKLDPKKLKNVLDISDDLSDAEFKDCTAQVKNLIGQIDISTKKAACIELVEKLVAQGKPVVIWCIFQESIRSIKNLLTEHNIKAEYIMGEVELDDRHKYIEMFRKGDIQVLVTNPQTMGEAVSLHTVCHDAVYFEYSYNLVHLLQSKDRIHRLGLPDNQYTQYYFVQDVYDHNGFDYNFDNEIYRRLQMKERDMLSAIDNNILEPTYTTDEDLKFIFGYLL